MYSMRKPNRLLCCALLSLFLIAHSLRAESTSIIPVKWQPDLSAAIDRSAADLKDTTAQMQMNTLSRQIADMKDAQLFVLYIRLYERVSAKEREQLMAEQTKWLKARTKAAREAIQSEGGSLAPLESNTGEADFTNKRISELTRRLASLEKEKR
jgi:uncharacterized protein YecT (DUF1311 family)